jgi:hypothetical protein
MLTSHNVARLEYRTTFRVFPVAAEVDQRPSRAQGEHLERALLGNSAQPLPCVRRNVCSPLGDR